MAQPQIRVQQAEVFFDAGKRRQNLHESVLQLERERDILKTIELGLIKGASSTRITSTPIYHDYGLISDFKYAACQEGGVFLFVQPSFGACVEKFV